MRLLIPVVALALAGWSATMSGAGVAAVRQRSRQPPLVFGIYPGGAAGIVGPSGPVKPEDAGRRLGALQQLRPAGRPFVVRLYAGYTAPGAQSAKDQVGDELTAYTGSGFQVELVVTYRPQTGGGPADIAGFVQFVRNTVRSLGSNPRFVSLQITNEANVGGAPNVADGYYRGAKDALLRGVIAAKQELRRDRFDQLQLGFNWAYAGGARDREFWTYLGKHGGERFTRAIDWIGLDMYPGTWGTALRSRNLQAGTAAFVDHALSNLRLHWMPLARIPGSVSLHVSENGYPTGPGRTEAMQVASMKAAIATINAARRTYNITSYTWFDLRDANTSSGSFQSQYGVLRDDYSPKPAFAVYRRLVAKLSRR